MVEAGTNENEKYTDMGGAVFTPGKFRRYRLFVHCMILKGIVGDPRQVKVGSIVIKHMVGKAIGEDKRHARRKRCES